MSNNGQQDDLDDLIMGGDQVVVMRVARLDGQPLEDDYRESASTMSIGVNRSAFDSTVAERPSFAMRGVDEEGTEGDRAAAPPMALSLISPVDAADAPDLASIGPHAISAARADKVTWGISAIGADKTTLTGEGVVVAVLDTGIKRDHPAFADQNLRIIERDYTGDKVREGDGVASDDHGHGTHCAGTICGRDVEGVRIGVARGVTKVLVAKVIGGRAGTKQLLDAMDWAISEGANVISMSLGFDHVRYFRWLRGKNVAEQAAVSQTLNVHRDNVRMFDATMNKFQTMAIGLDQHTLVVAAAGNEASRPSYTVSKTSPAAAIGVLSVGAVGKAKGGRYSIAPFSNGDPDLVGPGVAIVSAGHRDDLLVATSGTSMACPHIAGLAALQWQSLTDGGLAPVRAENVKGDLMQSARSRRAVLNNWNQRDYGNGLPAAN